MIATNGGRVGMFQHAAARRRLVFHCFDAFGFLLVSTRSRPKAAGAEEVFGFGIYKVSTRSRPKAAGFGLLPLSHR